MAGQRAQAAQEGDVDCGEPGVLEREGVVLRVVLLDPQHAVVYEPRQVAEPHPHLSEVVSGFHERAAVAAPLEGPLLGQGNGLQSTRRLSTGNTHLTNTHTSHLSLSLIYIAALDKRPPLCLFFYGLGFFPESRTGV